jgi:hypothetical protein
MSSMGGVGTERRPIPPCQRALRHPPRRLLALCGRASQPAAAHHSWVCAPRPAPPTAVQACERSGGWATVRAPPTVSRA